MLKYVIQKYVWKMKETLIQNLKIYVQTLTPPYTSNSEQIT